MKTKTLLLEIIETMIGAALMAASIAFFLLPNELSSGGFSGIATILYYTLHFSMGTTILCLNIPLFLLSGFRIGKGFFIKSIVGTVCLSLFTDAFCKLGIIATTDKILACVYGGLIAGIGTAIIFKAGSSTGGTEILSTLFKSYNKKLEMSNVLTAADFIIVVLNAVFLKNIEIALYSTITIYILGKMVDIIFEGILFTKFVLIVSYKNDIISKEIQQQMHRGVTGLYGKGMYTNDEKLILMCALEKRDVGKLKELVTKIDPNAFIIVTNSREVLGRGFKDF